MKKLNQLKSGVILSYATLALGSIIPFIYTPIMLNILGQSEYGLYSLANSVVGYLSLLNFGIGSAVVRYITKYRAEQDKKGEERMFGLFTTIYGILAALVLIAGIGLPFVCDIFYNQTLSPEELDKMKVLVILMSLNTAITFSFSTFSSVIIAHERFIFRKLLDMLSTLLAPCLNLAMLFMGFSTIGLVVSTTVINLIMYLANVIYCYKILKIKPRFKKMPFGILKEVASFSVFIFLGMVVDMLYWATDKLILGAMMGTVSVAIYNVGATFNSIVTNLSSTISSVLTPKVTTMVFDSSGNKELSNIFIKVGRLQYIIISFILSSFIVLGQQFINIWAGEDYSLAFPVALLTLVPVTIPLIQNIGLNIIIAQNKHRFRSIMYAVIAIINVVSSIFAVKYWGILGAAVCTCAAYVAGNCIIMNWYYYKKTHLDIPLFWLNILKMSPVPIVMTIVGLIVTKYIVISNWATFFICAIIYSIVFLPMLFVFSMNSYEKNLFLSPLIKIKNKLLHKGE